MFFLSKHYFVSFKKKSCGSYFILYFHIGIGHDTGAVTLAGYPVTKINIHNTHTSRRGGQTPADGQQQQ